MIIIAFTLFAVIDQFETIMGLTVHQFLEMNNGIIPECVSARQLALLIPVLEGTTVDTGIIIVGAGIAMTDSLGG